MWKNQVNSKFKKRANQQHFWIDRNKYFQLYHNICDSAQGEESGSRRNWARKRKSRNCEQENQRKSGRSSRSDMSASAEMRFGCKEALGHWETLQLRKQWERDTTETQKEKTFNCAVSLISGLNNRSRDDEVTADENKRDGRSNPNKKNHEKRNISPQTREYLQLQISLTL